MTAATKEREDPKREMWIGGRPERVEVRIAGQQVGGVGQRRLFREGKPLPGSLGLGNRFFGGPLYFFVFFAPFRGYIVW
jgi:hypothetical protein